MTMLDRYAALWAEDPTFTDDVSNDYRERAVMARNNRSKVRGILAECGTCDRVLDTGKRADVRHANRCADENRPYAYGR